MLKCIIVRHFFLKPHVMPQRSDLLIARRMLKYIIVQHLFIIKLLVQYNPLSSTTGPPLESNVEIHH